MDFIATSGAFVIPTLVTISSALGNSASALAADKRVTTKLNQKWLDALSRSINVYPQGKLEDVYAGVIALHEAGVDILAGCDVSEPIPSLGGLAHGASLHQGTATPSRGWIEPGRSTAGSHIHPCAQVRSHRQGAGHSSGSRRPAAGRWRPNDEHLRHTVHQSCVATRCPSQNVDSGQKPPVAVVRYPGWAVDRHIKRVYLNPNPNQVAS